jgi:uncharacterized protein
VGRFAIHPEVDQDSEFYWKSLKEHQAKLQKCGECGRLRFPPAPTCYYCGSSKWELKAISGKGTIYSWIVVHHPVDKRLQADVPFVLAQVELEEGPRIVGRLVNCDRNSIKGGMRVKVLYEDVDSELTLLNVEPDIA